MEFCTIEGPNQRFRVSLRGEGDPVVLLHGFPDFPQSWGPTADVLADHGYRVIVPYLRGYHPDTITPGRRYRNRETGGDLIDLLDALGLPEATVVGHDWGASVAWAASGLAPDRLAAMVPIAVPDPGTVKPGLGFAWQVRHFWGFKAPLSDARAARNGRAYIERLYRRWAPTWEGSDREEAVSRAREAFGDPTVLHHALEWYRDLSLNGGTRPRPACPILLVTGSADFGGDLGPYERTARRHGAETLVVDGAGHWPHREAPAVFHTQLLGFLSSL
ncbi:MAG: alpha/beta hydrolase [Acidimicrobiia bacterium]|nr:alpha/beta hydrolase [Acidimicrobiia bacterium]